MPTRLARGFTLIELMIVVAIVAILATIAYPAYTDYIIRSRLSEAQTALQTARVRMEQFFLDNRTYTGGCAQAGLVDSNFFAYTCAAATATTYTITATGQAATAGFVYTINEQNVRATTGSPSGWGTSATCWVARRGGACT